MSNLNTEIIEKLTLGEVSKDMSSRFKEIAKDLFMNCHIKKGENIRYDFLEIEFYYYSDKHPDLITYPRDANVGDWFFHASGVDICFQSKVHLDEKTGKVGDEQNLTGIYFGGILIRSLAKKEKGKATKFITGPQNCCYDLFEQFTAISTDGKIDDFPQLVIDNENRGTMLTSCPRYFKFAEDVKENPESKIEKLYSDHWLCKPEIKPELFKEYITTSEYRYFDKETFMNEKLPTRNRYYVGLPIND